MAKILIYGNPDSPLVRERGKIGLAGGHKVHWVSAKRAVIPEITSHGLPNFAAKSYVLRVLLEPLLVWFVIKKFQPDIVHVHYASKGLSSLVLAGKHFIVVTTMGSDIAPEIGFRGLYAFFTRRLLDMADVITSKSAFMDAAINNIGNYADKIRRIRWGVDLDFFKPNPNTATLRESLKISSGSIVFFDPRNAKPLYNKETIIEAFSAFLKKAKRSAVLLISTSSAEPRYLSHLRRKVDLLGIEPNIRFLPVLSREEMRDVYSLADITISAPHSDGLPQSIFEAMACGSFLILGDLPQYNEITEVAKGLITVPVSNVQKMSEAMLMVAGEPQVATAAKQLNRAYVEKYADSTKEEINLLMIYQAALSDETNRL